MGVDYIFCKYCNNCRIDKYRSPCYLCFFDKNKVCEDHDLTDFRKYTDLLCEECEYEDYNKNDAITNFKREFDFYNDEECKKYLKIIDIIDMVSNNEYIKKLNKDIIKLKNRMRKREIKRDTLIQSIKLI